jgi:hypothetical protein
MATRQHRKPSTPTLEIVPQSHTSVGRTDTHGNVVYNRILFSLPDDEYDACFPTWNLLSFACIKAYTNPPTDLNMDTSLVLD